jgi:hypothetical protein
VVAVPRVALLAVHETLTHFARGVTPNLHPAYDRLLAFAQSLGSVEVARSYGEWADLDARRATHAAGFEPTLSPMLRTATDHVGKRVTAAHMVVDGLDLLWQQSLEALVLATHDPEIAPLMLAAKRRGVQVVLVTGPDTPGLLREVADASVTYGELIGPPLEVDHHRPARPASSVGDPTEPGSHSEPKGVALSLAAAAGPTTPSPAVRKSSQIRPSRRDGRR